MQAHSIGVMMVAGWALAVSAASSAQTPATRPTTARAQSLETIERRYAERTADAKQKFDQANTRAQQERIAALRVLLNTATAAKMAPMADKARDALRKAENPAATQPEGRHKATIVFRGTVDGGEALTLRQDLIAWQHIGWDGPKDVTINGRPWDPEKSPVLVNVGETAYLPFKADFTTARLVASGGRDMIALQNVDGGVRLVIVDTPGGGDTYSATIEVLAAP